MLKKPEHALDGVYQGLVGASAELLGGVTGLFTKPYKKAREEGAVGFVKGVGSGFVGVVASPFTAFLKIWEQCVHRHKELSYQIRPREVAYLWALPTPSIL